MASNAWASVSGVQLLCSGLPFHRPPRAVPRKPGWLPTALATARLVIRPETFPRLETACGGVALVQQTFRLLMGARPSAGQGALVRGVRCGRCSGAWVDAGIDRVAPSRPVADFLKCCFFCGGTPDGNG